MNESNYPNKEADEIDLIDILRSLFRQRGVIFATTLCFLLLAVAYQLSRVAFSSPKSVKYPISIEFISKDSMSYPNGSSFSIKDIVSPDNIEQALISIKSELKLKETIDALSIASENSLFEIVEKRLLDKRNEKKLPKDQVESINNALENLALDAKTYATLSLDLSLVKLSSNEAEKLLEAIVTAWANSTVEKGLANPNVSYPSSPFEYSKDAVIIDNYDKLDVYVLSLEEALVELAAFKGSDTISVDGFNLNDLSRHVSDLLQNDIEVMRAYTYSISPQLVSTNPMLEVQIYSQRRVKSLNKAELEKQIQAYDEVLTKLDSNADRQSFKTQVSFDTPTAPKESNVEKGTLDELLDLGSQLSSSELKKEIIQKRIAVSESLFELEKELAMIEGEALRNEGVSFNQSKVIESMPKIFQETVNKVNALQGLFKKWIEEYRSLVLTKGTALYNELSSPYTIDSLGFSLKKVVLTLAAALLMGLFIGVAIALVRASFIESKKRD